MHCALGNAHSAADLCLHLIQVSGAEAPEVEVDEKNFLPVAPKNAEDAEETEAW